MGQSWPDLKFEPMQLIASHLLFNYRNRAVSRFCVIHDDLVIDGQAIAHPRPIFDDFGDVRCLIERRDYNREFEGSSARPSISSSRRQPLNTPHLAWIPCS